MIDILIFSKDRPCQLELLLRSMHRFFSCQGDIVILYKSTSDLMDRGYNLLKHEYKCPGIFFVEETASFEIMIKDVIGAFSERYCLFLCDDNVFVDSVASDKFKEMLNIYNTHSNIHSFSLRMNPNVDYCFPAKKQMRKPAFLVSSFYLMWDWTEVGLDRHTCWGYPMAVNAHVYRTNDIWEVVRRGSFHNVNSLEAHCNRNRWKDRPYMISFPRTKIFDVCNNYVKDDEGGDMQMTGNFLDGWRISMRFDIPENMVHSKVDFEMERADNDKF